MHHLAQGRVREDGVHEIGLDQFGGLADGVALDQLGDFRADHMRAQQFASLGIKHGFDKTFCLTQSDCLAIAQEWEVTDFYLKARLFGLGFGHADAGDLRVAIGAAGDVQRVHSVRVGTSNRFSRDHTLMACLMRLPWRDGDVANRPQPWHIGAAHRVGFQEAAIHCDAKRFQADIFGIGDYADGDDAMRIV